MSIPADHPCSHWHRQMYRRFAELGLIHTKGCGKPWGDHSEMGECPKAQQVQHTNPDQEQT